MRIDWIADKERICALLIQPLLQLQYYISQLQTQYDDNKNENNVGLKMTAFWGVALITCNVLVSSQILVSHTDKWNYFD